MRKPRKPGSTAARRRKSTAKKAPRKSSAKKVAAKKGPAKKKAAKKTAAKRTAAKKTAAKKAVTKKAARRTTPPAATGTRTGAIGTAGKIDTMMPGIRLDRVDPSLLAGRRTGLGGARPESGSVPSSSHKPFSLSRNLLRDARHTRAYDDMDNGVPLLLLPVRLETRFHGGKQPKTLKIRIFPDQVHLNAHDPRLTEEERDLGIAYWRAHHAAEHEPDKEEALGRLTSQIPPRRAAWVARRTKPKVSRRGLSFPTPELRDTAAPATADLLPSRWIAIGYRRGAAVFVASSNPVARTIPMELSTDGSADLLSWMQDYDKADALGMAITVDLKTLPVADRKAFDRILVLGLREGAAAESAADVHRVLEGHAFCDGLDFLRQGTPTNNTNAARAGWSSRTETWRSLFDHPSEGDGGFGGRLAAALGFAEPGVLHQLLDADRDEDAPAAAMNRALWPVTWGEYYADLMTGRDGGRSVVPKSAMTFVRNHFINYVRGGGPLPAIRIGRQPYGILPVRKTAPRTRPTTALAYLESIAVYLSDVWRGSLGQVPRIDPRIGATGGTAENDPESNLVEAFASLPHPFRFAMRVLNNRRADASFMSFLRAETGYDLFSLLGGFQFCLNVLSDPEMSPLHRGVGQFYQVTQQPYQGQGADGQIRALQDLKEVARQALTDRTSRQAATGLIDFMIDMVKKHRERQRPLNDISAPGFEFDGTMSQQIFDPAIFYSLYESELAPWCRALVPAEDVAVMPPVPDVPRDISKEDERRLLQSAAAGRPLLQQLLISAHRRDADRGPATLYAKALKLLETLPKDELELRMVETLGLASHRLDAWITSLATIGLENLRGKNPEGIHIAGFGWVEDLAADEDDGADSQGFIHTPSLNQAVTAAVLRSGWSAHGSADGHSPMAVDLSSERVRLASWLLDGVRQGHSLGALLGYRVERDLREHDEGLARWIDDLRRAVLQEQDAGTEPTGSLDGLALLRLHERGGLASVFRRAKKSTGQDVALRGVLDTLAQSLDAVGDAVIAEGVHQLLQGNIARAGSAMNAIADGSAPPPQLHHARTPRPGPGIEHRIVLLFGPPTGPTGWGTGPRAAFDPALEAWSSAMLGPPERVRHAMRVYSQDDGRVLREKTVSLADLRLSALDCVYTGPASPGDPPKLWRSLAERIAIGTDDPGSVRIESIPAREAATVGFDDFGYFTAAIRDLIGKARAMLPADLGPPGDIAGPIDRKELSDRLAALKSGFDETVRQGGDDAARLVAYGFDIDGRIPDQVAKRRAAWRQRVRPDATSADPDIVSSVRRAVAVLVGSDFPVQPSFVPLESKAAKNAFTAERTLLREAPDSPSRWLGQVAKVRANAQALQNVRDLTDILGGTSPPLRVAQLPVLDGDHWAAVTRPEKGTGGRLSLLALDSGGVAALEAAAPVSGLVVDQWVERIPDPDHVTGVAFHLDAPQSRPPQSLLLAIPPERDGWSFDAVVDILNETLDAAKMRAVRPQDLDDFGHHIPAIFSQVRLDPGQPDEEGGVQ